MEEMVIIHPHYGILYNSSNKAVTHGCIKKSLCHIKHTANGKYMVRMIQFM